MISLLLGNVLIDVKNASNYTFVICDFGFADYAPEANKQLVSGMKKPSALGITPRYAAPEVRLYILHIISYVYVYI